MSTRSMADVAQDYIIASGYDPAAIENVKRRAMSTHYDAQHDVLRMQFSDGSGCVVVASALPRAAREAAARSVDAKPALRAMDAPVPTYEMLPICRICNVASVLDAATQSVCMQCFHRLVSHTWRVMPLVQSLVLQHRIDSGTLPKFAPDPELQARAERAEEEAGGTVTMEIPSFNVIDP